MSSIFPSLRKQAEAVTARTGKDACARMASENGSHHAVFAGGIARGIAGLDELEILQTRRILTAGDRGFVRANA
jgi:hypothetical protein